MNRKSISVTQSFNDVNALINKSFLSEQGPGDFPLTTRNTKVFGIVAPHFDYTYGGAGCAWSYKEIAESEIPETFIILGRGEKGINTYLYGDWDTPFDVIKIDKDFGRKLITQYPKLINNYEAFVHDTTIEFQLPYLQFSCKGFFDKVKFVPLLIGDDVSHEELIQVADSITDVSEKICVICSAHLTCYGKHYGFVPFLYSIQENMYNFDHEAMHLICDLQAKEFYDRTRKSGVFDRKVITLFMEIMRSLGCKKGQILNYYTSGDLTTYENAVGFASLVFKQ